MNVHAGADVTSARVVHSYFLTGRVQVASFQINRDDPLVAAFDGDRGPLTSICQLYPSRRPGAGDAVLMTACGTAAGGPVLPGGRVAGDESCLGRLRVAHTGTPQVARHLEWGGSHTLPDAPRF